jgi:hypothetical protein
LRQIDTSLAPLAAIRARVRGWALFGGIMAAVGVVVGLAMALHATHGHCIDATRTTTTCDVHNHAGEGTAIAVICAALIVLFVLAVTVADAVVDVLSRLSNPR